MSQAPSKRIAYVTGTFPRPSDTFIQREIVGLKELGYQITPFSMRRPDQVVGPLQNELANKTTYVRSALPTGRLVTSFLRSLADPVKLIKTIRLASRCSRQSGFKTFGYLVQAIVLASFFRENEIDHVHNHFTQGACTTSMLAAELTGVGFSFTVHGPSVFFESDKWSLSTKAEKAKFVVCVSNFCVSQLKLFTRPEDWAKFEIIHCGVEIPEEQRRPAATPVVAFVGVLDDLKGPQDLLRAFAASPVAGSQLVLIGDGPARQKLVALAKELGVSDRVEFTGFASPQEVRRRLSKASVFCLPSYAEGVPVSLMEAMAAEVPVVTTTVAGIPELVDHERSGFLVAPGDIASIQGHITELLTDTEFGLALGKEGRRKVEQEFTSAAQVAGLADLFDLHS